jgi:hypothetical protein
MNLIINKLNIDFDNWDNIYSNEYWYLNCFNHYNTFITYVNIDSNRKINNKIEILFHDNIHFKKLSFDIFVDINKIGLNSFNNNSYYLISNNKNITMSDLSDEFLIDFKNKTNCKIDIRIIKNKISKYFLNI